MTVVANAKAKYIKQQHYLVIITEIEGEIEVDFKSDEKDMTGDTESNQEATLPGAGDSGAAAPGPVAPGTRLPGTDGATGEVKTKKPYRLNSPPIIISIVEAAASVGLHVLNITLSRI